MKRKRKRRGWNKAWWPCIHNRLIQGKEVEEIKSCKRIRDQWVQTRQTVNGHTVTVLIHHLDQAGRLGSGCGDELIQKWEKCSGSLHSGALKKKKKKRRPYLALGAWWQRTWLIDAIDMKVSFILSNHSTSLYSGPKQFARYTAEPIEQERLIEAGKDMYDLGWTGL